MADSSSPSAGPDLPAGLPAEMGPHPVVPAVAPPPPPPPQQFPTVRSEDGRLVATNESLVINGQQFGWWELESVDVQRVRWLLWLLLGGFTLAGFLLGFLQNWLHTMPAVLGITTGALLLALGQRGTNRLRLHRLGREAANFALPGELATWQKLAAEVNRRIRQRQHETAVAAMAALAQTAALPPDSLYTAE